MYTNNINSNNIKHLKKLNLNKINFHFKCFFIVSFLSIISYFFPFEIFNNFDYGVIIEIISLVLVTFSFFNINNKKKKLSKLEIIFALIILCLLLFYDFIYLFNHFDFVISEFSRWINTLDKYFYSFTPFLIDLSLLVQIILLFKIFFLLNINEKNIENNANFYEKL